MKESASISLLCILLFGSALSLYKCSRPKPMPCTPGVKSNLQQALEDDDITLAKELFGGGEDPLCKDSKNRSAYSLAMQTDNVEMIQLFGYRKDGYGNPLDTACIYASPKIISYILDNGAKFRVARQDRMRCLANILTRGDENPEMKKNSDRIAEKLIREAQTKELEEQAMEGNNPLMLAVIYENSEMIRLILSRGVNVNIRYTLDSNCEGGCPGLWNTGRTALDYAKLKGNSEIEKMLIQAGAME
ncbi:ankyrin repeat domain-containing protein [Leptospira wolffii]|uniref:ankyrin repeat domain-containing protein n=1 Tax=Leptospira wolffii TaxID=409998 RepID=UPI000353F65C|nr:ankyrin repeat domain-containing protein [Leptospira wolffii]EPG65507.1 ankyrin repeat protein [Leptospira wolffii serovar Khorat str. Khorat-H2]